MALFYILYRFTEAVGSPLGKAENEIRTDTVIVAKRNEMTNGHFLLSAFVFSNLIIGGTQNGSNLNLG